MSKFKAVIFVYGRLGAGAIMCCIQPAYCLNKAGNIASLSMHEKDFIKNINKFNNSLIIFLKAHLSFDNLSLLKSRGNKLVYHLGDAGEDHYNKILNNRVEAFDLFLAHAKSDNPKIRVIKHSYDLFLDRIVKDKKQKFGIVWCGNKSTCGNQVQGEFGLSESGLAYDEKNFQPLGQYLDHLYRTKSGKLSHPQN